MKTEIFCKNLNRILINIKFKCLMIWEFIFSIIFNIRWSHFKLSMRYLRKTFFKQFIKRFHHFDAFKRFRKIINNLNFFIAKKFSEFVIKKVLSSIAIYCIRFLIHYKDEFQTSNHVFDINYFDNEWNIKSREVINCWRNNSWLWAAWRHYYVGEAKHGKAKHQEHLLCGSKLLFYLCCLAVFMSSPRTCPCL